MSDETKTGTPDVRARLDARWPGLVGQLDRAAADVGPAYLVGGFVRDLLLGKTADDLDLVAADPKAWARSLAYRGKVVVMDAGRGHHKAVAARLPGSGVDIAPIVGGTIESDLGERDFTLNAMAIEWPGARWVDPFGGEQDLRAGLLQPVSERSLPSDPLRALRAHRFSVVLGLKLSEGLRASCVHWLQGLNRRVAPERVRKEWRAILEHPRGPEHLMAHPEMSGLWGELPGEPWGIACERLAAAREDTGSFARSIWEAWRRKDRIADGSQAALLAGLLIAGGPDLTKNLGEHRCSRSEMKMALWAGEAVQQAQSLKPAAGSEGIDDLALVAFLNSAKNGAPAALMAAHGGSKTLEDLGQRALWLCRNALLAAAPDPTDPLAGPRPLVTGNDIFAMLDKPSARMRVVLSQLYEEQWAGMFAGRDEALARARSLCAG